MNLFPAFFSCLLCSLSTQFTFSPLIHSPVYCFKKSVVFVDNMRNNYFMVELLVLLSLKIQVECDKQASQVVDQFVIKRQFKEKV